MLTFTFTFNKAFVLSMLVSISMVIVTIFFYCDYIISAFVGNVNFSDDVTICIIIGDSFVSLNIGLRLRLGHETCDGLVVPFINDCWFINTFYVVCSFVFFNHGTLHCFATLPYLHFLHLLCWFSTFSYVFCNLLLNVFFWKFDYGNCPL